MTIYSIHTDPDGEVCIHVEDGPTIARGERDLILLEKIAALAIREVKRRRELEAVRREIQPPAPEAGP